MQGSPPPGRQQLFSILVRSMVRGVLGENRQRRRVCWNALSQARFDGSEIRIIDEVLILMGIIFQIVEFLEAVAIADEAVALIGNSV